MPTNKFFLSARKVIWLDFREERKAEFKVFEALVVRVKESPSEEFLRREVGVVFFPF